MFGLDELFARIGEQFAGLMALDRWLRGEGQASPEPVEGLARLLGALLGGVLRAAHAFLGGAIQQSQAESIITQLPLSLTVQAPWVRANYDLFAGVARAALLGAFGCALLAAALGGLTGIMWGEAKALAPAVLLVGGLITRGPQIAGWLVGLANALAGAFAQPGAMLPGWQDQPGAAQFSGEGLASLVLVSAGLLLALSRWMAVLFFDFLLSVAPLALLCAILPGLGWLWAWWLRAFSITLLVHVPIAIVLGMGAALAARFGAGGDAGLLVASLACLWLALRLPGMLPGLALGGLAVRVATTGFAAPSAATAAGMATTQEVAESTAGWGTGGGDVTYGSGPTYRSQPLLPAPMHQRGNTTGDWEPTHTPGVELWRGDSGSGSGDGSNQFHHPGT